MIYKHFILHIFKFTLLFMPSLLMAANLSDEVLRDHQKQINSLKKQLNELKLKYEKSNSSDSVKLLEKKISTVDKKLSKRTAAVKRIINRQEERLSIAGFLSAGVIKGEGDYYYGSESNRIHLDEGHSFKDDAIVGIQFNYKVSEKVQAVTQLVSRGYSNFDVDAEWAYLKYSINSDLAFRFGRMRVPVYHYSETLDVGFTYPWVRPPIDLYANEVTSVEGMDVLARTLIGGTLISGQFMLYTTSSALFNLEDGVLANVVVEKGPFTGRLAVSRFDAEVKDFPVALKKVKYYVGSFAYDDGDWLSTIELNQFDLKSGPQLSFVAGYVSLGRRIGRYMPYLMFAKRYTDERNDDPLAPLAWTTPESLGGFGAPTADLNSNSWTFGARYEINSKTALKIEATHYGNFVEDRNGIANSNALFGDSPKDENDDIIVYSAVIDAVF